MNMRHVLAIAALMAAGCTKVIVFEADMPPLLPLRQETKNVFVGAFTTDPRTPKPAAKLIADLLADQIRKSPVLNLADQAWQADLIVTGQATCVITEQTVRRLAGVDGQEGTQPVKTYAAETAVKIAGDDATLVRLFVVTEKPLVADRRRLARGVNSTDQMRRSLLRECARLFVADISPRRTRVRVPRPRSASSRTKRGIDLLATDPSAAILELAKAIGRDPDDAAAANALGLRAELAGNLEQATRCYLHAAASDFRDEYQDNARRVMELLERRKALFKASQ